MVVAVDGGGWVENSPPGTYDTPPISQRGSGWDVPTGFLDVGAVAGARVSLTFAGIDGVFATSDDLVVSSTTGADGTYSFTTTMFGEYRISVVDLPLPDRSYLARYFYNDCVDLYGMSAWQISSPDTKSYDLTVAAGDQRSGFDFLATNSSNRSFGCS